MEEPERGWFRWMLAEAAEGLSIWHDLKAAEEWAPTYKQAMAESLLALQNFIEDLDQGPQAEPSKPKGSSAVFGFGSAFPISAEGCSGPALKISTGASLQRLFASSTAPLSHRSRAAAGSRHYKVTPGDRWTVICLKTNATAYSGVGPVEILRERAAA